MISEVYLVFICPFVTTMLALWPYVIAIPQIPHTTKIGFPPELSAECQVNTYNHQFNLSQTHFWAPAILNLPNL